MQENVTEAKQRPADHHGDGIADAVDDDDDVVTGDDYNQQDNDEDQRNRKIAAKVLLVSILGRPQSDSSRSNTEMLELPSTEI